MLSILPCAQYDEAESGRRSAVVEKGIAVGSRIVGSGGVQRASGATYPGYSPAAAGVYLGRACRPAGHNDQAGKVGERGDGPTVRNANGVGSICSVEIGRA